MIRFDVTRIPSAALFAWLAVSAAACGEDSTDGSIKPVGEAPATAGSAAAPPSIPGSSATVTMSGGAGMLAMPNDMRQAGAPAMAPPANAPAAPSGQDAGMPPAEPMVPEGPAMPGATGIGDDYFPDRGNGGYDATHYDLKLHYTPSEDRLKGTATISITPTMHLSRFNLDFLLEVSEVTVDGMKAEFTQEGQHELVITPAASLHTGKSVDVVVTYSGVPSSKRIQGLELGNPWWRTRDGAIGAGAPENAWWWFPSNDHPSDKATFTVSVTVPDGLSAISNGVQPTPPVAAEAGFKTWTWVSSKPQQPNLALLVIGEYEMIESKSMSGLPVVIAYSKNTDTSAARPSVERTAEIIAWEETVFGPYPFEALGGVVGPSDGINYALETQTRPIYPISYFRGGGASVVVHENAHQWFGDSAAALRWRDVWLSEGFATYAEWLWSEAQDEGSAQSVFDSTYARYRDGDPFWQVEPGDPGAGSVYDAAVYQRGAMTLHQVRLAAGDDKFFQILKTWSETKRYGNASTEDFKMLASMISGKNLDELFETWLFTKGRPQSASPLPVSSPSPAWSPPAPRSWYELQATPAVHRPLSVRMR